MSQLCKFPNCNRISEKDGYCIGHTKIMRGGPTVKQPPKPIAKKSKKRIREDKEYKRVSKELNSRSGNCEIKSPVCTGKSEGLDHAKGRVGKNFIDKKYLKRACNACNQYCSDHPAWAADNAHAISRLANVPESHEILEDDPDDFPE